MRLIRTGDTVGIGGFIGIGFAQEVVNELAALHLAGHDELTNFGMPRDLTLIFSVGSGDGTSRGVDRLAQPGLVKRTIGGHWAFVPTLQQLAVCNKMEAYNLPLGVSGGGAPFAPERSASQLAQSVHQLPSCCAATLRHSFAVADRVPGGATQYVRLLPPGGLIIPAMCPLDASTKRTSPETRWLFAMQRPRVRWVLFPRPRHRCPALCVLNPAPLLRAQPFPAR